MPKSKVKKTAPRAGTFATRRRDINRRIQEMILATLTPHQRELLRRTRGNPHLAFHLRRHIEALLAAEQALESLGVLDPSTTVEAAMAPYLTLNPTPIRTASQKRGTNEIHR